MRILLTNDDGYLAEGIREMEKALLVAGHTVIVAAPHTPQSAMSHSMTVGGEIRIHRHDSTHYSVEGTPADTVIYTLRPGIVRCDVVVSGINHGWNAGSDILYSGTCSAARQASMDGLPAVAISAGPGSDGRYSFRSPAVWLSENLEKLLCRVRPGLSFLNINFPSSWNGQVEDAGLEDVVYHDDYSVSDNGSLIGVRSIAFTVEGREIGRHGGLCGDFSLLGKGCATVSVLYNVPDLDREAMLPSHALTTPN